ncbi:hypothetical protein R3P38DRAFT_3217062 [Favolaschia claudopus]|uniref:Uncharacterized protein n=1 Tax=Favolaschia claudopus TaxID=2862362 RepID=A0AAW0A5Q1_9AGAR
MSPVPSSNANAYEPYELRGLSSNDSKTTATRWDALFGRTSRRSSSLLSSTTSTMHCALQLLRQSNKPRVSASDALTYDDDVAQFCGEARPSTNLDAYRHWLCPSSLKSIIDSTYSAATPYSDQATCGCCVSPPTFDADDVVDFVFRRTYSWIEVGDGKTAVRRGMVLCVIKALSVLDILCPCPRRGLPPPSFLSGVLILSTAASIPHLVYPTIMLPCKRESHPAELGEHVAWDGGALGMTRSEDGDVHRALLV